MRLDFTPLALSLLGSALTQNINSTAFEGDQDGEQTFIGSKTLLQVGTRRRCPAYKLGRATPTLHHSLVALFGLIHSVSASAIDAARSTTTLRLSSVFEAGPSPTTTLIMKVSPRHDMFTGSDWTTYTRRCGEDPQSDIRSILSEALESDLEGVPSSPTNEHRPLAPENYGNADLPVDTISPGSGDSLGQDLSGGKSEAKLQAKLDDDDHWALGIDTVVSLLALVVAILGLPPAYIAAFVALGRPGKPPLHGSRDSIIANETATA